MPKLVTRCASQEEFDRLKEEGRGAQLTEAQFLAKLEDKSYLAAVDGVRVVEVDPHEGVEHGVVLANEGGLAAPKPKPPPVPASSFAELFRFASGADRLMVGLGCFFAVCQGAYMPCFALVMGGMIDSFADRDGSGSTGYGVQDLGIGLILLGCFAFVAAFFQGGLLQVAAARQQPMLKQAYLSAILRQDVTWMDLNPPGKVQSTIAQDMDLVTDAMGEKFGEAIQTIVQFVLGLVVGFIVSWQLSLLTLGLVPVMAVSMGFLMATIMKISARVQLTQANAAAISQESTGSIRTVCSLTSQAATMKRYEKEVDRIQTSAEEFHKSLATSLGGFMFSIYGSYSLAMWYGSTLVEDEIITGGQVLTVFWAILIGGLGLASLGTAMGAIGKGRQAAHTILGVIDRVPLIDSSSSAGLKPSSCGGALELRDVHFAYPTRAELPIFKGYNLKVKPGETVALVGESGGGKSTVISLLERFYDPTKGQVLLDGNDLKDLNVQWLRDQIGLVSQEPVLFATTIMENIRNGKRGATDAEVLEAARMANAHAFITGFTDGYETEVGERGIQLSGGQKQRIAIARAIIKDPPILLLDEATSALDSVSEEVVQKALDQLLKAKKRTTIIVAHRMSTIRNADSIAVVYNGAIVEQGTHAELSAIEGGYYVNLTSIQSIAKSSDAGVGASPQQRAASLSVEGIELLELNAKGQDDPTKANAAAATKKSIFTVNLETTSKKELRELKLEGLSVGQVKARLWKMNLEGKELPLLLLGFAGSFVTGLCEPVMGMLMGLMISAFFKDADEMRPEADRLALYFLALAFTMMLAQLCRWPFGIATSRLSARLRLLFFERTLHQDISYHDSLTPGVLTAQIGHDIGLVERASDHALSTKISLAGTLVGMAVICLIFSWQMTLVMCVIVPLVGASGSCAKSWWRRKQEDASKKIEAGLVTEAVGSARTVLALRLQDFILDLYRASLVAPQRKAVKDACITSANAGFAHVVSMACYGFVFFVGAELKSQGMLTTTQMLVTIFVIMFSAPSLGRQSSALPDELAGEVAAARLFHAIDRAPVIDSSSSAGLKPSSCGGALELRDVHFAYPTRAELPIFKGYNLKVKPGETVALVGESGGGKSTVISLLERFYDPTKGQVLLDGNDLKDLNVQWLRDQIGLVSQEPVLFATTIMENIRNGKRGATDAEVFEAARMANAHAFITGFPKGYATEVGERGVSLSGGQKQRIAIARAIIKDPQVLLLDEATSALDSESESAVQAALDALLKAKRRTTVVVAHRLSTIRHADSIAVVYDGVIVEQGTHDELMAIPDGNYRRLARRQQAS